MGVTEPDREFTITRRLARARPAVFHAWTSAVGLQWFENPGHPAQVPTSVDLRVGGAWRLHMVESASRQYMTGGVYREIVPDVRLSFRWGAVDGWPALDPEALDAGPLVSVELRDVVGGTEMALRVEFPEAMPDEEVRGWLATGMADGWALTVARLGPALAL